MTECLFLAPSEGGARTDEPMGVRWRDPAPLLARTRAQWGGTDDLWLFGYASLIWRPECAHVEHRDALVRGWHRSLRMQSRVNRGSVERPGLVFALMSGGCTKGVVYRVPRAEAAENLERLWAREMTTGAYEPRWLRCQTAGGAVRALAFTLSRRSPGYTGPLSDDRLLDILRTARGRCGTTLDYVLQTASALRERGIVDRHVETVVALARHHRLG